MNAVDFALLAQEAYSATPDIGVADSASRAIVRQTAVGLCIAFPGTNNAKSVIADINFLPLRVPRIGRVHAGFWKAWLAIQPDVLAVVGGGPVTFVGHSLGAALAIIAAAASIVQGNPPVAVWGFEPPHVSPDDLSQFFASVPMTLFKNGNDPVPDVPLAWPHPVALTHIGKVELLPDVDDHLIANVIEALQVKYGTASSD